MNEKFIGIQQPIGHTGSIKNSDECPHKHNIVTDSLALYKSRSTAPSCRLKELTLQAFTTLYDKAF